MNNAANQKATNLPQPSTRVSLLDIAPTVGPVKTPSTPRFGVDEQSGQIVKRALFKSAADLIGGVKPASWVVKGLLERDALGLLFGPSGEGKSFFTVDIACCVATGTPWHGQKVRQGPVIYIAGEGQGGMGRRLAAWEKANGVSLKGAPLYISTRSVSFLNEESANEVIEEIEHLCGDGPKPVLSVIDTVARAFIGGDENSAKDMSTFINIIDTRIREPWQSHVLMVHHTGHEGGRARGSSALKGVLDQELSIVKSATGIRELSCTKMKDAQEPAPRCFKLVPIAICSAIDDFGDVEEITSCVIRPVDASEQPVSRVAAGATAITPADLVMYLVDEWPGVDMLSKHLKASKKQTIAALQVCADRGLIKKDKGGQGRGWELTQKGKRLNMSGAGSIAPEESALIEA